MNQRYSTDNYINTQICLSVLLCFLAVFSRNILAQHIDQTELLETKKLQSLKLEKDDVTFYVHYRESQKEFAHKTVKVIKEDIPKIHQYFDYKPKTKVHFLISDSTPFANGFASVFPANTVILNNYPPIGHGMLSFSKDWIRTLVIHEYVHIVTLEMTEGILSFLRFFVGSTAKFAGVIPRWMSEGIATWAESVFTNEGRLRNPAAKLMLKNMAHDPLACHEIDCLDFYDVHPYGNSSYIIGAFFMEYLEKLKPNSLSCIFKKNGRRIPFFVNAVFKKCTGDSAQNHLADFWKKVRSTSVENKCDAIGFDNCHIVDSIINRELKGRWVLDDGTLVSDNKIIAVANLHEDNRPLSQSQKHLFIFNKLKQKASYYKLDYPLEKIYWVNKEENLIGLTFIDNFFIASRRKNFVYKLTSKGIKRVHANAGNAYTLKRAQGVINLDYRNSEWKISRKKRTLNKADKLQNLDQDFTDNSSQIKWGRTNKVEKQFQSNDVDDYNALKHMNLNYLLFLASYSGELLFLRTSTELTDPYNKHSLALSLDYYFDVEDVSPARGSAFYRYLLSRGFSIGLGYSEQLSRATGAIETNEVRNLSFVFNKAFIGQNFKNDLSLVLSQATENDFLSTIERVTSTAGLRWGLIYKNNKLGPGLRNASLSLQANYNQVDEFDSNYFGVQAHSGFNWMLSPSWYLGLEGHYGRYFKDTLNDGALYLGGANSTLTGSYPFPAYSLAFQDGFGNEVLSSRIQLQADLGRPGWGSGFLPLYWQSWRLLGGAEYLKADIIQDGVNFKRDSDVYAYFGGLQFDFVTGYSFPLKVKLIYSVLQDSILENNSFLITVDAPFVP